MWVSVESEWYERGVVVQRDQGLKPGPSVGQDTESQHQGCVAPGLAGRKLAGDPGCLGTWRSLAQPAASSLRNPVGGSGVKVSCGKSMGC